MGCEDEDMTTPQLCANSVLSVDERACRVWAEGDVVEVRFSATFPRTRVERVAPGHMVAGYDENDLCAAAFDLPS